MRVLLITGSFPPMRCGVGDYTQRLATALAEEPDATIGVMTSRAAAPYRVPVNIELLPIVEGWNWSELGRLLRAARRWAPDIVHIQYPTVGYAHKLVPWLMPLCLRLAGLRVVQTWHEIHYLGIVVRHGLVPGFVCKALVPGSIVTVRENYRELTHVVMRAALINKTMRFIPNASAIPAVSMTPSERAVVRAQYARPDTYMIVYFGFIYPLKRVELLFEIASAEDSHLVIIGDVFRDSELKDYDQATRDTLSNYHRYLMSLASADPWRGKVTLTGFLPADEAARLIAASDAVVLPILGGAGEWNSSVHAAQAQGTFVLTTSKQRCGYDPQTNTFFASDDDVRGMAVALKQNRGKRLAQGAAPPAWRSIAKAHIELYQSLLTGAR